MFHSIDMLYNLMRTEDIKKFRRLGSLLVDIFFCQKNRDILKCQNYYMVWTDRGHPSLCTNLAILTISIIYDFFFIRKQVFQIIHFNDLKALKIILVLISRYKKNDVKILGKLCIVSTQNSQRNLNKRSIWTKKFEFLV